MIRLEPGARSTRAAASPAPNGLTPLKMFDARAVPELARLNAALITVGVLRGSDAARVEPGD